jgi:hypothetical protein
VIERCRSVLGKLEEEHYAGVQYVAQYLETQPTNADLRGLLPPVFEAATAFPFPVADTVESEFLKRVLLDNASSSHKNSNVHWFIQSIVPLFQMDGEVAIFGTAPLACALWYLSRLWENTTKMFSPEPADAMAWQAVMDAAGDAVREKFRTDEPKPVRKALAKLLKSVIANRTIPEENADEVARHLGMAACHLAQFYPLYSYLNRATLWLHLGPHIAAYQGAALQFGNRPELRHLYRSIVSFPSNEPLFEFRVDRHANLVLVSPLKSG